MCISEIDSIYFGDRYWLFKLVRDNESLDITSSIGLQVVLWIITYASVELNPEINFYFSSQSLYEEVDLAENISHWIIYFFEQLLFHQNYHCIYL